MRGEREGKREGVREKRKVGGGERKKEGEKRDGEREWGNENGRNGK